MGWLKRYWRWLTWRPTHLHLKSGGLYRVLREGRIEKDLTPAVVYESEAGDVWIRPSSEFYDGRFRPVSDNDRSYL